MLCSMGQVLFGQSESRWFSTLSFFFPDNIGSSHLLSSFWGCNFKVFAYTYVCFGPAGDSDSF